MIPSVRATEAGRAHSVNLYTIFGYTELWNIEAHQFEFWSKSLGKEQLRG